MSHYTRTERARNRQRQRHLTLIRAEAAIRFYAASMPDHEPEGNDDEEDGSPSFTEPALLELYDLPLRVETHGNPPAGIPRLDNRCLWKRRGR